MITSLYMSIFFLYLELRFQVVRQIAANKDTSHKSPANFII